MANARHVHAANPVYSQPVLRSASPTNTITTEYGEDDTSQSDRELSDEAFAQKVEMNIGICQREDRSYTNLHVLLPKPRNGMEEQVLHEQVLRNLRQQVRALEDEEVFEASVLTNLQANHDQQPSSFDIDEIMRSLLNTPLDDNPRIQTDQRSPTPMTAATTDASSSSVPMNARGARRQTRRA